MELGGDLVDSEVDDLIRPTRLSLEWRRPPSAEHPPSSPSSRPRRLRSASRRLSAPTLALICARKFIAVHSGPSVHPTTLWFP